MKFFSCTTIALLCISTIVIAQISPGPLSKGHANLEGISNCTKCHESGHEINGGKCLSCHIEIKNEIDSGHGFHFASASSSCITCHKEHLGKEARITKFDVTQFDHARTGFVLTGGHSALRCEQCHDTKNIKNPDVVRVLVATPHTTFLGLESRCVSCHSDRHNGTVGTQCQTCHGTKSWKPAAGFDHGRTRFALVGKHKQVECTKCHGLLLNRTSAGPILFSTKSFQDCTPCHASPHGRRFFDKTCRSCHTAEGWSFVASFDHATTRFPLVGSHATVPCEKCHTQMKIKRNGIVSLATESFVDCTPCHSTPHNSRISGKECKSCHTPTSWSTVVVERFDHLLTNYALEGKHVSVKCNQCHNESLGTDFKRRFLVSFKRCTDCHSDPHNGQFRQKYANNCAECHTVTGFTPSTFSIQRHDSTLFSLNGAHIATPCVGCHRKINGVGQVFRFVNFRCESCHEDVHKGQFAKQMDQHGCAECHSTVQWRQVFFDHARTRFTLVGKHLTVKCSACHTEKRVNGAKRVQYVGLPIECDSCHKDVHVGQFAENGETRCAACHSPASWQSLLFNHETQSSFHLTGAHKNVLCGSCHKEEQSGSRTFVRYRPLSSKCESCHVGVK